MTAHNGWVNYATSQNNTQASQLSAQQQALNVAAKTMQFGSGTNVPSATGGFVLSGSVGIGGTLPNGVLSKVGFWNFFGFYQVPSGSWVKNITVIGGSIAPPSTLSDQDAQSIYDLYAQHATPYPSIPWASIPWPTTAPMSASEYADQYNRRAPIEDFSLEELEKAQEVVEELEK